MDADSLRKEKAKLEEEIQARLKESEDIVLANENLLAESKAKEIIVAKKEHLLTNLMDRNAAELAQIEMEEIASRENCDMQLKVKEAEITQLQFFRDRVFSLKEENDRLRDEIKTISDETSAETFSFAEYMHQLTLGMKNKRGVLEDTLKRELNELDVSCQIKAFSSLDENKKQEMLTNASLKDEIALQNFGIANLTARLNKQNETFQMLKAEKVKEELKAKDLREQLVVLRSHELSRRKVVKGLQDEVEILRQKRSELLKARGRDYLLAKNKEYLMKMEEYFNVKSVYDMWRARLIGLKMLRSDIQSRRSLTAGLTTQFNEPSSSGVHRNEFQSQSLSVNELDEVSDLFQGFFTSGDNSEHSRSRSDSTDDLAVLNLVKNDKLLGGYDSFINSMYLKNDMNKLENKKSKAPKENILTLQKLEEIKIAFPDGFTEIFTPLKGREGIILRNGGITTLDNNVVSWCIYEINELWKKTDTIAKTKVKEKTAVAEAIVDEVEEKLESVASPLVSYDSKEIHFARKNLQEIESLPAPVKVEEVHCLGKSSSEMWLELHKETDKLHSDRQHFMNNIGSSDSNIRKVGYIPKSVNRDKDTGIDVNSFHFNDIVVGELVPPVTKRVVVKSYEEPLAAGSVASSDREQVLAKVESDLSKRKDHLISSCSVSKLVALSPAFKEGREKALKNSLTRNPTPDTLGSAFNRTLAESRVQLMRKINKLQSSLSATTLSPIKPLSQPRPSALATTIR